MAAVTAASKAASDAKNNAKAGKDLAGKKSLA